MLFQVNETIVNTGEKIILSADRSNQTKKTHHSYYWTQFTSAFFDVYDYVISWIWSPFLSNDFDISSVRMYILGSRYKNSIKIYTTLVWLQRTI